MELAFAFEELPLIVTDDGYETAFVSGLATINYGADGHYRIEAPLELDLGRVVMGESGARKHVAKRVNPATWKWAAQQIELTLLTDPDWKRRIADAIEADMRSRQGERESPGFLRRFARLLEV